MNSKEEKMFNDHEDEPASTSVPISTANINYALMTLAQEMR